MNQPKTYTYNLGQYFSTVAQEQKDAIAIRYVNRDSCTFSILDSLSNQIAHFLIDKKVQKNDVVVVLNNKSNASYAIMLACLKIGAIYTNLDPKSPEERFDKMLGTCQPKLIYYFLDQKIITAAVKVKFDTINFEEEDFIKNITTYSSELPSVNQFVNANDPAYIMFTSGSTGFPKGVCISHGNVINFIQWAKATYSVTNDDVFTNINPMHFDNSVFDFYASIFNGASLIPINENLTSNPKRLIEGLNIVAPTIWFSVPSMLVFVLNMRALNRGDLPTLRIVTFGGEGFPKNQLRKLWGYLGERVKFINVYGPTECTCICSSYIVAADDLLNDDLLPLGIIAANFYSLVLDKNGNKVKNGNIGELYIGGPNVGIGYFNNPEKTESAFIADATINNYNRTLYKSGDLVKLDQSGTLFFCGRTDNQIKKMGYRIELEEIENALNAIEEVLESAVVYVDNENYTSKIIAFINSKLQEKELKDNLKKKLPFYMMPDTYNYVTALPKNQSGKIDKIQLRKEFEK